MRYILDDSGYIDSVSCTPFNCKDKSCQEYTGTIPSGYDTLQEWAQNANIRAYKIVSGNLVYDAAKDAELNAKWAKAGQIENYSTEEQIIGTWVNGKPIYRQIIPVTTSATNIQIATIKNMDDLVNLGGAFRNGNDNQLPINYYYTTGIYLRTWIYNSTLYNQAGDYVGYTGYVIVEYTKTTDEAVTV